MLWQKERQRQSDNGQAEGYGKEDAVADRTNKGQAESWANRCGQGGAERDIASALCAARSRNSGLGGGHHGGGSECVGQAVDDADCNQDRQGCGPHVGGAGRHDDS